MWQDEPGSERGRARRRRIGAAVVLGAATVVAGVHLLRGERHSSAHLRAGFAHLAAAAAAEHGRQPHLDRAERSFRRAIGVLSVDPLALIALSLLPDMARELGRPAPAPPPLEGLTERAAIDHGRALLRRGRWRLALGWVGQARARLGRSEGLSRVQLFAELWGRAARARGRPR